METMGSVLLGLHPEVRNWLREHDASPVLALFSKCEGPGPVVPPFR